MECTQKQFHLEELQRYAKWPLYMTLSNLTLHQGIDCSIDCAEQTLDGFNFTLKHQSGTPPQSMKTVTSQNLHVQNLKQATPAMTFDSPPDHLNAIEQEMKAVNIRI